MYIYIYIYIMCSTPRPVVLCPCLRTSEGSASGLSRVQVWEIGLGGTKGIPRNGGRK